jgi:oligoribonuclease NrnB/cAMP/cGMP phosphodiesterase (DHH superfamily)
MKCFYHNDPDGWCSAFWVRNHCEKEGIPFTDADFIEVNYDMKWLVDRVEQGEKVFMVDFSVDPEQMILFATNTDFTWIDHHISAIEKMQPYMEAYSSSFKGIRSTSVAACALTWLYFNCDLNHSWDISDLPEFTKLIHLWDTWQWKNESMEISMKVEGFITRLISDTKFVSDPLSKFWNILTDKQFRDENLDLLIKEGYGCLLFRDGYAESLCSSIGKIIEFEGFKCFVCNIPKPNSEWFKSVDTATYDIMLPFYYNMNTEQFIVSLYTTNPEINVAKIAEKHGGGGHKGAAGFQCKELPWSNQ